MLRALRVRRPQFLVAYGGETVDRFGDNRQRYRAGD